MVFHLVLVGVRAEVSCPAIKGERCGIGDCKGGITCGEGVECCGS